MPCEIRAANLTVVIRTPSKVYCLRLPRLHLVFSTMFHEALSSSCTSQTADRTTVTCSGSSERASPHVLLLHFCSLGSPCLRAGEQ